MEFIKPVVITSRIKRLVMTTGYCGYFIGIVEPDIVDTIEHSSNQKLIENN